MSVNANTFQEDSDMSANVCQSTTTPVTDTSSQATVDSVSTETSDYTALVDLATNGSTNILDTDTDTSAYTSLTEEAMDLTDSLTSINTIVSTPALTNPPTNTLMRMANPTASLMIVNTNISTAVHTNSHLASKVTPMANPSNTDANTNTTVFTLTSMVTPTAKFRATVTST